MRSITITERQREAIGQVIVGLVLFGAIVLSGCDAPGERRTSGGEEATAVATARVTPPAETVPAVAAPEPEIPRVVTYEEAELAYRDGRYDEAARLFSRYVEIKPGNPFGHYMLGLSGWKSRDHAGAEAAFERALALDPDHVKSHLNLVRVLLEVGRPEDALVRADTALALDPLNNVAHRLRARALDALDRVDEAIDEYRQAIALDETDVWSMNNLGVLYIQMGWSEEALYPLARAVALDTTQTVFFNNLGMALEHTGRWARAADVYRLAVGVDSTHARAIANLARVDGRPDDALVPPVDLALLAQEFAGWIGEWKRPEVAVARQEEAGLP
ncbi:MAG TPA: tetratricopeptide repeat protein [Gemmatimonadales bacterium]